MLRKLFPTTPSHITQPPTHSVYVGGEWLEGVQYDEMTPGERVNETAPVTLSQYMQDAGLVEVYQVY